MELRDLFNIVESIGENIRESPATSLGGLMVAAGFIVGAVVNPKIGEALKAGGTAIIGLMAKDNKASSNKVRE